MLAHAPPKRNRPPGSAVGAEWQLLQYLKQNHHSIKPPADSSVIITLRIDGDRITPYVQPATEDRELTERERRLAIAIADAAAAVLGAA